MAKFKTSINLADAIRIMQSHPMINRNFQGDFFVVVDSFDFGRDINGNTINKYRATLHRGDLATVENNYSGAFCLEILTSPKRREQTGNDGQDMALYWLEKIGYDLKYESFTIPGHTKKRAYRYVYRVTNNYTKDL